MRNNYPHRVFVDEYLKTKKVGASYLKAFPKSSVDSSYAAGSRLLKTVKVEKLIKERMDELKERAAISIEQVLDGYRKIAFGSRKDAFNDDGSLKNVTDIEDELFDTIAGIEVDEIFLGKGDERIKIGETKKIKFDSRQAALDAIRDTLGYKAATKVESEQTFTFKEEKTYEPNPKNNK